MTTRNEKMEKAKRLDGSYLFRTFRVKHYAPTNTKGARIKIEDCNFDSSVWLSYDYSFNSITEQAIFFLLSNSFDVQGIVSGNKDGETVICCKWTSQEL